jgi:hypothetical protein
LVPTVHSIERPYGDNRCFHGMVMVTQITILHRDP